MAIPACLSTKAIYGLQRSGFEWSDCADAVARHHGWSRVPDTQEALYYFVENGTISLVVIYVVLGGGRWPVVRRGPRHQGQHGPFPLPKCVPVGLPLAAPAAMRGTPRDRTPRPASALRRSASAPAVPAACRAIGC